MLKKLSIALIGIMLLMGDSLMKDIVYARNKDTAKKSVHNVVLMIPDGYSTAYATNYRWFKGDKTVLDSMLVGMARTYSASSPVTDSAAAGTAMATGQKTANGMISMSPNGQKLQTILEATEKAGKSSGLVATTTISHATPATFASHVLSRANETEIAPQLLENDVDVLLSGGRKYFLPKEAGGVRTDKDLMEIAEEKGYTIVDDKTSLQKVSPKSKKLLGLFAMDTMQPELDRKTTNEPSLKNMTEKALQVLSKDKNGFFLMVEGSQIDWGGHAHDAAWAMNEAKAFEEAVKEVISFAKKDKHTLVVVVGDHDTGGMSVGGYGLYEANVQLLRNITATGNYMVSKFTEEKTNIKEVIKTYTNLVITDEEEQAIQISKTPANTINDVISKHALIGWTTSQHTGVDVPLYAYGPQTSLFSGVKENTDIPKLIAKAMRIPF